MSLRECQSSVLCSDDTAVSWGFLGLTSVHQAVWPMPLLDETSHPIFYRFSEGRNFDSNSLSGFLLLLFGFLGVFPFSFL